MPLMEPMEAITPLMLPSVAPLIDPIEAPGKSSAGRGRGVEGVN